MNLLPLLSATLGALVGISAGVAIIHLLGALGAALAN